MLHREGKLVYDFHEKTGRYFSFANTEGERFIRTTEQERSENNGWGFDALFYLRYSTKSRFWFPFSYPHWPPTPNFSTPSVRSPSPEQATIIPQHPALGVKSFEFRPKMRVVTPRTSDTRNFRFGIPRRDNGPQP